MGLRVFFDINGTGLTEEQLTQQVLQEAFEAGRSAGLAEGIEKGQEQGLAAGRREILKEVKKILQRRKHPLRADVATSLDLIELPESIQNALMRPIDGSTPYATIGELLLATHKSLLRFGVSDREITLIDAALHKMGHQRKSRQMK